MNTATATAPAPAAPATAMDEINARAKRLADARQQLGQLVQALNAGLEALKANEMPAIRDAIAQATTAWSALEAGIQAAPALFIKPRTVAAHGITFGIEKGKGSITVPDPDRTVLLIRRHMPDQAAVLIASKEVPVKKALAQLSVADLKRIGAQVGDADDRVVIRPAPSDVDKLVAALVRAELDEAPTKT